MVYKIKILILRNDLAYYSTTGTAGTNGAACDNGATGIIIVTAHFQ